MIKKNEIRKVVRSPKIFSDQRTSNKSFLPKLIFYACLIFSLLVIFVYIFFFAPWFKIKNIDTVGRVTPEIKDSLNVLIGKNLFSFRSKKIELSLMQNRENFSKIKIYRGIPDTVRVVFQEREPKIIWQIGGSRYLIDQDAIAFRLSSDDYSIPIVIDKSNLSIELPSKIAPVSFVNFVRAADSEFKKNKFNIVNYEVEETTFQVSAVTDTGFKIILNTFKPLSDQIDALNKVYGDNKQDIKEYIDLRVEGKVYYK